MNGKYIVALSDAHGHLHMIYTEVTSKKDLESLKSKMLKWDPKFTPNHPYGDKLLQDEVFNSLKKLTGHEFHVFYPDFKRSYGDKYICLPTTYDWR